VFSLGTWSSQIPAGLHVSCGTRVFFTRARIFIYRAVTVYGLPFHAVLLTRAFVTRRRCYCSSRIIPQPQLSNASKLALNWFRLIPVRSPLLGESLFAFFSPRELKHLSNHRKRKQVSDSPSSGERTGISLNLLRASLLALRNWGRGIFQGEQQLSRRVTKAQSNRTAWKGRP